jgi:hypothetical protein
MTAAQKLALADVVFDAVALDGPTASGVERFRVVRYVKSSGPDIARVRTGRTRMPGGGGSTTSVSIAPAPGETWRIYAQSRADGTVATNQCLGSHRLAARGQSLATMTVAGGFGIRMFVEAPVEIRPLPTLLVQRGERLRLRFSFRPTRVAIEYGRLPARRLRVRRTVAFRVPRAGEHVVRVTVTRRRLGASAFTRRFAFRVSAGS